MKALEPIQRLRNSLQHVDERLVAMSTIGGHPLGWLSWVQWPGPPSTDCEICLSMTSPNSPHRMDQLPAAAFASPSAPSTEPPVGAVTLFYGVVPFRVGNGGGTAPLQTPAKLAVSQVDLTALARSVERFAHQLETEVVARVADLDPTATDPTLVRLFEPG